MLIRLPTFRSAFLSRLLATALAAATFGPGIEAPAGSETFVVAEDGYGVTECLKERSDCGRIVADAWCEAHGHGPAQAYGATADATAAIPAAKPRQQAPAGAVMISCSD
jgi:hypothetical protein